MTDAPPGPAGEVRAAGGAVWRRSDAGAEEVLVIHRPRYDDWSLPKGKCDPGETFLETAVREVAEETGATCAVGPLLGDVRYVDHRGRPKVVRYWALEHVEGGFVPNDEVDEVAWMAVPEAADRLSYPHDRQVLDWFAASR